MATTTSPTASSPKRSSVAALTSVLFPGWGQVYAGRPNRGKRLFVVNGAILAFVIVLLAWLRLDFLKLWVSTTTLALMMVANLLILGYRWLAATDAYQLVPDGFTPRWRSNLVMGLATAALVLPHLAFGYITVTQYSLISSVFGSGEGPGVVAAADTDSTTTTAGESVIGDAEVLSATITNEPEPDDAALWNGFERLNVVLLGADAGEGRDGLRTDTTIVVSLDPVAGDAVMLSVPRDLSAPLPEGMGIWDCNCFEGLFANLYRAAEENPEAFPGPDRPGINAIKGSLEVMFGIPIHYYALVTLEGFVDIVDALGGVTIEVPNTIVDETYPHENGSVENITIRSGTRHLNGHEALAYARIRRHSDDFARMHRQRCVIEAVVEQSSPTEILFRFGAIAEALKRSLVTDIPQERLSDFIDLLPKVSTDRIASLRITRGEYKVGSGNETVYYDIDRIRADAQALLNGSGGDSDQELGSLDGACEGEPESGF